MVETEEKFEEVWGRIIAHAGEEFRQIKGGKFHYKIEHNVVKPDRTEQSIPKSDFEKAFALVPLRNTTPIQELVRGPSYVYAILMDHRVKLNSW